MRLKKLELYGFKSFSQRTEIVFNEGITGIVGPNGSGKSNIGDAVRWVLGEQSAKTLRGASMQDVIFNGTQQRKPHSYCEVSLVFDNEDRALPLDFAEVMVTRRVYRNGDSEYYLNRSSCRLKDVIDLFRDTGIGKEGYSIIGQGRIDEILSRRGEDRRLVFEEAAGIVKYRARKEEADKRLEHTLENMTRVDDILEELGRRVGPLEEQAKSARIYLELSAELKVLDLNLFLIRSERMENRLRDLDSELQGLKSVLENAELLLQQKAESRDTLQNEIADLEEKISAAHENVMAGMEALHEAENALTEVENRQKNRQTERERLQSENESAEARLAELEALLNDGGAQAVRLENEEEAARKALDEATAAEEEARRTEQERETALEDHKEQVMEAINRLSAVMNDQTRLKTMRQTMEQRLGEIENSLAEMKTAGEALQAGTVTARERLAREEAEQKRLADALTEIRAGLEQADAEVILARKQYDDKLAELRTAESRQKLLSEMSEELEGYNLSVRKAIQYARTRGNSAVHGVLAQLINVPREYETAVDMVLGAAQQNIVTDDEETAKTLIDYLRTNKLGRATFLPITSVRSKLLNPAEKQALRLPGCLGVASDLITCDDRYRGIIENLLGRTVIADNLDHGIAIMRAGHHAFRLVTLAGDVMHSGGSMTGGSVASRAVNFFSRERELKELTETLQNGQTVLERLLHAMQDGQQRKNDLKTQSADALEALHQQEIAVARETERLENAVADAEAHAQRTEETDAARLQLTESLAEIDAQLSAVSENGEETQLNREEMDKKTAELQRALTEARECTAQRNAETVRLTLALKDLQHDLETLRRDRGRFEEDQHSLRAELRHRNQALADMAENDTRDAGEAAELRARTETCRLEQTRREQVTHSLEERRASRQEQLKTILGEMEGIHQSFNRDNDRMHRADLSRSRTEGDLKTLRDRIWNTYELTVAGAEEFRVKDGFNIGEADKKVQQLNSEIRALGTVNVKAVEEYAETKARFDELSTQRKDLETAEKDLRELIGQLLDKMRVTFVENFTRLQGYFSETFVRLFGGGQAELKLMDPEDPLNCGIEINAQPPGKKLQLLSLLSGGERTLTAIAILFATLKLKPTPFCILDEIEAALDDANIGYFADYLVEYSKGTQFVVITHRKGTMERCNALYGVAMEEQGVSKMVSVSLQNYQD